MVMKLKELMFCFSSVLITLTIIPLMVITFPIWFTVLGMMKILSDRHPRFNRALQSVGITLK